MTAQNENSFQVNYQGSSANALIVQINNASDTAEAAYNAAIADLGVIKDKLTGSAEFGPLIENIQTTETSEVNKIVTSLKNMVSGVQNIGVSWQGVSAEIHDALANYASNQGNDTNKS